jgi:Htaa
MTDATQPRMGRGTMLPVVIMAAALFALLAFAPFASAASDPLGSGTTTINLNKGFFKKLKKNDVKVLKVSPGKVKNRTVTLPVSGGSLDPLTGQGTVNDSGGFKFKHGKKTAALKNLVLDTTKKSLSAKLGKKNLKIASVAGITFTREGFGTNVKIGKLKLTGKAAKELNKKLGFGGKSGSKHKRASTSSKNSSSSEAVFKANQLMGGSTNATQPSTVAVLPTGNATLKTDLATVKKFGEVLVNFVPIAPATEELLPLPPLFTFPIGGGTIAPNATAGTVQTLGGVKLVQKELEPAPGVTFQLSMTLNAIWIDLGTKQATVEVSIDSTNQELVKTPGNIGRSSIADINLTGATIKSDPAAHTVTIENAKSTLQAVTAATLNEVFAKPLKKENVFVPGDPLGTFSFTAQTQ